MKVDTILYIDDSILNEAADPRVKMSTKVTNQTLNWPQSFDPNSQFSYGSIVQSQLEGGFGRGYSVKVTDFGTDIFVEVSYSNQQTGRMNGKTFLIKMKNKTGEGWIKASAYRYRTITGIDQAISYIRSVSANLKGNTSQQYG